MTERLQLVKTEVEHLQKTVFGHKWLAVLVKVSMRMYKNKMQINRETGHIDGKLATRNIAHIPADHRVVAHSRRLNFDAANQA